MQVYLVVYAKVNTLAYTTLYSMSPQAATLVDSSTASGLKRKKTGQKAIGLVQRLSHYRNAITTKN